MPSCADPAVGHRDEHAVGLDEQMLVVRKGELRRAGERHSPASGGLPHSLC